MDGNPSLYITRRDGNTWINNAKVDKENSNLEYINEKGKKQVNIIK